MKNMWTMCHYSYSFVWMSTCGLFGIIYLLDWDVTFKVFPIPAIIAIFVGDVIQSVLQFCLPYSMK